MVRAANIPPQAHAPSQFLHTLILARANGVNDTGKVVKLVVIQASCVRVKGQTSGVRRGGREGAHVCCVQS